MAYQRTTSSFYSLTGNRLHLRNNSLTTNNTNNNNNNNNMKIGNTHYDLATEDNEEEENSTIYLKEKYSNDSQHPYYSHPSSQYHHVKPLVLFSFDLTHWSPILQYLFLIGGLIIFMCLYGYYQELVIYGWFNRKLSIFSTFLHFLGCTFFAQLQRNISSSPNSSSSSNPSSTPTNASANPSSTTHNPGALPVSVASQSLWKRSMYHFYWYLHRWTNITMGTASSKTAIGYYLLLVFTKTAAQGLSNLSMTEINYPAKVLFKSANPIITIFLGLFWFRKTYPIRDYIVVLLLIFGLYIFITSDNRNRPECTTLGIVYVVLSMFGSAGVPMIQEHCITTYNASIEDLLYFCFLGSTIVSLLLSILNGEFLEGILFLINSSSIHIWIIFIAFCTFGFIGANFSTAITAHYGSLVNGLANTFRKAVTIIVSFLMFPERNELTVRKVYGALIFFSGLLVSIFYGEGKPGKGGMKSSALKVKDDKGVNELVKDPENLLIDRYVEADTVFLADKEPLSSLDHTEAGTKLSSPYRREIAESFNTPPTSTLTTSISSQFPAEEVVINRSPAVQRDTLIPPAFPSPKKQYGFEEEKAQLPRPRQVSSQVPPPITNEEIDIFIPETILPAGSQQLKQKSFRINTPQEDSVYDVMVNNVSSFYQNLNLFGPSEAEKTQAFLQYSQQELNNGNSRIPHQSEIEDDGDDFEDDDGTSRNGRFSRQQFTV